MPEDEPPSADRGHRPGIGRVPPTRVSYPAGADPRADDGPLPDEGALVAIIDAALRAAGIPADLEDDCGAPPSDTALVSTDTLVEGGHFDFARDTAEQVGAQAAVANLSDLAGSGGAAGWAVWSLSLPARWTTGRFRGVVRGFVNTCAAHGCAVIGGNLSRIDGPAVIAVTVGGPLVGARAFPRSGARPGDRIYVTGPLGDAALGYLEPDAEARQRRHRWRPHLTEARALAHWGHVTAAMDVSDGLALDLDRLLRASGCAARLVGEQLPTSSHYRARRGDDPTVALTGGEDYVLLFCAPPEQTPPAAANAVPIGRVVPLDGPRLMLDGAPLDAGGHDHFRGRPLPDEAR